MKHMPNKIILCFIALSTSLCALAETPQSAATLRQQGINSHSEFYTRFRYKPIKGLEYEAGVNRRDPSSIIKVEDTYYVWYTRNESTTSKWLDADIWYATSKDGLIWKERGPAVRRPAKPTTGFRSICTPDVLVWQGRYYLYFQAYSPMVGGQQHCPVMAAVAESALTTRCRDEPINANSSIGMSMV